MESGKTYTENEMEDIKFLEQEIKTINQLERSKLNYEEIIIIINSFNRMF